MQTGLRTYKPDRCYSGYTLYCPSIPKFAPNEEPRGEIYLVDMEGEIVHRWPVRTALQSFCRLLPDGNLLYPTNDRSDLGSAGIREIDPEGEEHLEELRALLPEPAWEQVMERAHGQFAFDWAHNNNLLATIRMR